MNANQRSQLTKQLLPLLRRGWPRWGVSHSRRTGDLTLAPTPDPHQHPKRWCVVVHCPTRRWQIMQGGGVVASGPDPADPHQVYEGRDWLPLMGENILAAWRDLVSAPDSERVSAALARPDRTAVDPDTPKAIRARYARQGDHNLLVQQCSEGNPAAAIHLLLGLTKAATAALVGESASQWSRYTHGHKSPTYAQVHGWLERLRAAGHEVLLFPTAAGVTATEP